MPGLDEAGTIPAMMLNPFRGKEKALMSKLTTTSHCRVDIIDIRGASVELNLKVEIKSMFCSTNGPRELPTLLLYDERGLQLFEKVSTFSSHHSKTVGGTNVSQITYLDEYYLTNDEIKVLTACATEMAKSIPSGAMVIELGSG